MGTLGACLPPSRGARIPRFLGGDWAVDRTFAGVINLRRICILPVLLATSHLSAGTWSNRGDNPGNQRLVDLDPSLAASRFSGRTKAEIEAALGSLGRQVLVPTADGGWIAWDQGSPGLAQTWVYSLRRSEARGLLRGEIRREDRRLVLEIDETGKIVSVVWACDTSAWQPRPRALF